MPQAKGPDLHKKTTVKSNPPDVQNNHHSHHKHHKEHEAAREEQRKRDEIIEEVIEMPENNEFEEFNRSGINDNANCYCQPNWWCCCRRCIKIQNAVGLVGFFDALVYLCLSMLCLFSLLMWESTGKHAKSRGFAKDKIKWLERIVEPNMDGIYMLMASYIMSTVAGWNLGLRFNNMKRCPPVWWMLTNVYTTGLQITSMACFPFFENYLNCILIGIRLYQYWIVWFWDRVLCDLDTVKRPARHKKRPI